MQIYNKQISVVILIAWLMSLSVFTFQICCDNNPSGTAHHHSSEKVDKISFHVDSSYCEINIAGLDSLEIPLVNSVISDIPQQPDSVIEHNYYLPVTSVQKTIRLAKNTHPPPLESNKRYFSTLRIRL